MVGLTKIRHKSGNWIKFESLISVKSINFDKNLKTGNMKIPAELKYTEDHEWIRVEGDSAIVGITDFAQGELGDVVFVEIETEGEELDKGETFGTVEAVKTVSDLFMPVDGVVSEVNEALADEPELVNKDPYGKGWMIKIKISDQSELENLLSAEDYKKMIEA
jgi:glycine cleavage system H protein